MGIETTQPTTVLVGHQHWYRVGATAALTLAIGYIVIFPLYARVGAPPHDGEAWFSYLVGKTTIWWTILGLSVFTDMLFLPVALALYLALREVSKNTMLMASSLIGLFVVLDLAVTWSHYASILTLYERYSTTMDQARRGAYIAAVDYASAMLTSRLEIVYAIVILSSGILLTALVMLKSRFSKVTAYLGLVTGTLGILSLTGFSVAIIGNAVFATIWLVFVAFGLYRLARQ